MKYLTIAVSTLIVASFLNKMFTKAMNGDDESRRAIKRNLDEKREEFERRRGRPLDALDDGIPRPVLEKVLASANAKAVEAYKAYADGCAMGSLI